MSAVAVRGGVGERVRRIDGVPKVTGSYAYGTDLRVDGMLFGATLRSPQASARVVAIDTAGARRAPGVLAVLTAADVPGRKTFGLEFADQPVLALDVVRYEGEPVALVAAETEEQARAALELVEVRYEPLPSVVDMVEALRPDAPQVHPFGNVLRHLHVVHGDLDADAEVWVEGFYETAMQDAAPLGPEGGIAVPRPDGGVDLFAPTQWLHVDRQQTAACLALPEETVRLAATGVGGAFGSREDIHVQIHACLLALATGRPVKLRYGREESFHAHVHRHPARIWIRYGATRDGRLVAADVRLVLDGGAYASSSAAVLTNAATFACGPYEVPNAHVEATAVYTNNPPCGAMRGFGAPQVCFAYESAMDALAGKLGLDLVELRLRNALREGSTLPTGQVLTGSAPVREVIERCRSIPLPGLAPAPGRGRLGIGFAVGFKNVAYSEGFDDAAEATVTLRGGSDGPVATVRTAAVDYGQGLYTVLAQIVRTELGVEHVDVEAADTTVGSAGSTSSSRQTTMTGGAVQQACREIRGEVDRRGLDIPITRTCTYHHRPTTGFDADGQGDVHAIYSFVAERALVEVDEELGLARVVQLAVAQDAGKVINPLGAEGQVEGAASMGLGLALMEELDVEQGAVRNPTLTDYVLPTTLDVPAVVTEFVEEPEPGTPYGAKGIGELPTIAATPAIVSALRHATGKKLNRVPVRPDDLVGLREPVEAPRPPIPDVPGQQAVPEYAGLGAGQQELMKGDDDAAGGV